MNNFYVVPVRITLPNGSAIEAERVTQADSAEEAWRATEKILRDGLAARGFEVTITRPHKEKT